MLWMNYGSLCKNYFQTERRGISMPSERVISAALLGVASVGLLAIVGYNLWIAPPAEGLTVVNIDSSSISLEESPELDTPIVPDTEHPLDLNAATEEELDLLPGIGEVLAGRIVQYREEHGPFQSPEDLLNVDGIGESTLADIRDRIIITP